MANKTILGERKVIVKSLECIKAVARRLDKDQGLDGTEFVLSKFTPNQVISDPESVLDMLIKYVFCVHGIDWYCDKWSVSGGGGVPTLRPGPGAVVTSSSREQEVEIYLQGLVLRTKMFLQVIMQSSKYIMTRKFSPPTGGFFLAPADG